MKKKINKVQVLLLGFYSRLESGEYSPELNLRVGQAVQIDISVKELPVTSGCTQLSGPMHKEVESFHTHSDVFKWFWHVSLSLIKSQGPKTKLIIITCTSLSNLVWCH